MMRGALGDWRLEGHWEMGGALGDGRGNGIWEGRSEMRGALGECNVA